MNFHQSGLGPVICLITLLHMQVKWGPKPSAEYFKVMPRTAQDAKRQGFVKINDCDAKAKWRGARYVRNNDPAVTLLYDINGYIAGIQTAIPKNLLQPYPRMTVNPVFVEDGGNFALTAYFVDPATICGKGRTRKQFSSQGTGTNLYIQNGTNAESNSILIPRLESAVSKTKWIKGFCFPSMGIHYWYNIKQISDCQALFPVFLLYNNGQLNAFGWALMLHYPSQLYEHTTPAVASRFMSHVPECLKNIKKVSTMHIYMTHDTKQRLC